MEFLSITAWPSFFSPSVCDAQVEWRKQVSPLNCSLVCVRFLSDIRFTNVCSDSSYNNPQCVAVGCSPTRLLNLFSLWSLTQPLLHSGLTGWAGEHEICGILEKTQWVSDMRNWKISFTPFDCVLVVQNISLSVSSFHLKAQAQGWRQ